MSPTMMALVFGGGMALWMLAIYEAFANGRPWLMACVMIAAAASIGYFLHPIFSMMPRILSRAFLPL